MDHEHVSSILEHVSYKPGWNVSVGVEDNGRLWLQVRFDVLDVVTGEPEKQRGRKWFLSPYMTVSEVVSTAFKAFLTAEEHECREAFSYRGQRVLGPHMNLEHVAQLLECGLLPDDRRVEVP